MLTNVKSTSHLPISKQGVLWKPGFTCFNTPGISYQLKPLFPQTRAQFVHTTIFPVSPFDS